MPYAEAMDATAPTSRTCAPGWSCDLGAPFRASTFAVFRNAIAPAGTCAASSPGRRATRAKDLDDLVEQAKQLGAAGLVWARSADGAIQSSALKAAGERRSAPRSTEPGAAPATCC